MNWSESLVEEPKLILDEINIDDITYYATNDYIETNIIIPDCTKQYAYYFTDYEVKASLPVVVVDKEGNEKTTFKRGEGFKLRIPLSEIENDTVNFQAKVLGKTIMDSWGTYSSINEGTTIRGRARLKKPEYLINCDEKLSDQIFEPLNINYNKEVGKLNIKVIDVENKIELKDAEVVVYDQEGNIVYRYKTTGETLNITLPVGEYTIKQIIPPPNYQARIVEQKVAIAGNKETTAVLENIPLVEVPDTAKTAGILPILGMIILMGGIAIIIILLKNTRTKIDNKRKN